MDIETLSEPGGEKPNEDALLVRPPRYGVFDGATAIAGHPAGGAAAARLAAQVFERDLSLDAAVRAANAAIADAMAAVGLTEPSAVARWSTTAAVADVGPEAVDWLAVGDSAVVLAWTDGRVAMHVEPDHDVETKRLWMQVVGTTDDPRAAMADEFARVRARANLDWGVLNGDPLAERFVRRGRVPRDGLRLALLLTDGAYPPCADPAGACDPRELVRLVDDGGLSALRDHVRALERGDPRCEHLPRFKRHDDLTAIALRFR